MRMGTSVLHFGQAHPAAHGVLRCILMMRGEYIVGSVLTLGLLHRGTEKLMEVRHVATNGTHLVDHECQELRLSSPRWEQRSMEPVMLLALIHR